MILTVHLLAGAVITQKFPNLFLGLFLAFLSHYFLDFLFHREYIIKNIIEKRWRNSFFDFLKVALDISFGILLILVLSKNILLALAGGFLGILPDGLTLLFLIFPKNGLFERHYYFHRRIIHFFAKKKIPLFWGILSQILTAFIAVYFLRQP